MGPGRKILHDAVHPESPKDPGESQPDGQAALPAAFPAGMALRDDGEARISQPGGHGVH